MKGLSPGDVEVLNGLIVLGVAIGLAALFMPFRQKRGLPRPQLIGLASFELFAAVAIFSCAFLTVYLALAFLEEGKPISDGDLRATASPLAVAATLLLFLTVFSRLPDPLRRSIDQLPLMLGILMLALVLGFAMVLVPIERIPIAAGGLLVVDAALAALAWALERRRMRRARLARRRELARLRNAGYRPQRKHVRLSLPEPEGAPVSITLDCWAKDDRLYLDRTGCWKLGRQVEATWDALCASEASPPAAAIALAEIRVPSDLRALWGARTVTVVVHDPSAPNLERTRRLTIGDDGLLAVDELLSLPPLTGDVA